MRLILLLSVTLSFFQPLFSTEWSTFFFCVNQVLSEWAKDLVSDSPDVFGEAFGHVFGQQMVRPDCLLVTHDLIPPIQMDALMLIMSDCYSAF